MKPKNKIYPLLRMLAVALTAALLGPGCQKDFKWNEPLAVTQNGLNLTSPAGSTRVTVYSTGRWKAEMAEGAWGEVSEVSGNGIGDFLFTYEANNGVSRRARILVSGEGEEQEIVLTQAGAVTEPTLALAETEFEFVRLPRERVQIGVTTNMTQALECILITATDVTDAENPAEAGWLKEIRLEKDAEENIGLVFGTTAAATARRRSGSKSPMPTARSSPKPKPPSSRPPTMRRSFSRTKRRPYPFRATSTTAAHC